MDLEDWITVGVVFGVNLYIGMMLVVAVGAIVAQFL
jgi:hypothetical protein